MEGKHQLLIHNKKGETGVVEASTDKKQATQFKKTRRCTPPECTMHNSRQWLEGNVQHQQCLHQHERWLCIQISKMWHNGNIGPRIRSPTPTWDLSDERLTYLSIHHHMHKPAMPELKTPRRGLRPSAKFLVANFLGVMGLGASFLIGYHRFPVDGVCNQIDRITSHCEWGHHAKVGAYFFESAPGCWASCERKDAQWFFLPAANPCVSTLEDVQYRSNAALLEEKRWNPWMNPSYTN